MSIAELIEALKKERMPYGYPEIEWWDTGNYDDTYEIGISVGRYELAQDLLRLIGENPNEFLGV